MYRSLRRLAGVVVVLACLPAADAQALDGPGYLALADRLQRHLDPFWNESLGRYDPGPGLHDRHRSTATCCSCTRWRLATVMPDRPARTSVRTASPAT